MQSAVRSKYCTFDGNNDKSGLDVKAIRPELVFISPTSYWSTNDKDCDGTLPYIVD